jgi:hypothetical protein
VVASLRTFAIGAAGAVAIALAARARSAGVRRAACGALPLVVMADLFGAHWFEVPTIDPSYWNVPPPTAQKIKADPSFIRLFGEADRHSAEPGYISEPIDFPSVRDTLDWSIPPVWGLRSAGGETPMIPSRMVHFNNHASVNRGRWDVTSVTHVVTGKHSPLKLGPSELVGSAKIHKNPGALPRARLMGQPVYVESPMRAINALDRLQDGIRDRLVIEDPDRPLSPDADPRGTATITRDDPEHVAVTTECPAPAYLVLADTFDPGWTATVDGRPAPIRPAWLTLRAVYLPAGRHEVVFRYSPAGFETGRAVSLAGLAVSVVLIAWPRRLVAVGASHAALGWPLWWPRAGLAAFVVLLALSSVYFDQRNRFSISDRWTASVHQFTWGAGIQAMLKQDRRSPPPLRGLDSSSRPTSP